MKGKVIILLGIVILALAVGGYVFVKARSGSVQPAKSANKTETQTNTGSSASSVVTPGTPASTNPQNITQIELILDDSGSMAESVGGQAKIDIAKDSMNKIIDQLKTKDNLQVALRIYGHQNKECTNSVVEIPMGKIDADQMKAKIKDLVPLGYTPIYYSLTQSVKDFNKDIPGDKIVVLVTDGLESCNGDPCAAAKALKTGGVITKMNVVGFGLTATELNTLQCIVDPFGGKVVGASNPTDFLNAMEQIMQKALDKPNLNVTIVGVDGKPLQASDICVYPAGQSDKEVGCAGMYTSEYGFTMKPGTYDVKAVNGGTSGESWVKNIEIKTGETVAKVISFAEGKLEVTVTVLDGSHTQASDICVYPQGETLKEEACAGMFTADYTFTLKPGIYDVKVSNYDGTADVWSKNIEIKASETVTQKISI